ncbi:bifunctional [glutamine synthetase] adenylyltransferase/[glutamine synthetase]-adenylyl-L-tyrosine phosphorylase [Acetobacter fallax]|uniref:Bifunctional [glutamine synthetase] adenylyltransferase/[glutamine synthetase]-adenylyl-L-tyrosine phosphorylase n=2 Tax=Acetobacter fallax TaxID=1737473 RepID=A0ABX0KA87_9PROT|nr:bifunctional [glutamine synthetase] adenylyltransferase/[glutamine synthetase]-adenylyl-L-tyrosine phosphorylase [Acetobacter fallax]NHO32136.1 bifunctional [glutamine synthetase] adenylyltransferase/[glutamine synthetase]-adenylyl-L-tyrosine phosphorylase [Acetobacter fallax]NHO35593.1 bifunctional [glutamine synthetase] adenylyltransferase/[glutamine synthetase]-adenylyl-L-tyrosine phosphorylase [Acetobacter fallax]
MRRKYGVVPVVDGDDGGSGAVSEVQRGAGWRGRRHTTWPEAEWPQPADPEASGRFTEDLSALWDEAGLEPSLLAGPGIAALLRCVGGNSPYLADLIRRAPHDFARLLADGPDLFTDMALAEIAGLPVTSAQETVASALRQAKGRIALASAIADIGKFWPLESVTQALSRLADTALDIAVRHLLRAAHDAGRLSLRDPARPASGSGYVVLAMGKLGARELNFSSDIDLVALFDTSLHADPDSARQIFIRMTSDLVRLMEARDANGYVFRTDLRLRPDPSATPLAVSMPAAISYYESLGQTWERAAMTKARPVAGNIALGRDFLRIIHPFVWRRTLDFALIDDIHDMKAKIDRHRKPGRTGLAGLTDSCLNDADADVRWLLGHNVKLGEGGIREIEFVAQAMQLVWGGRTPNLRDRTTLGALRTLTRSGHMPREDAETLARAYRLLREIEHRVQMRADQQTHQLPETEAGFGALAVFLGYASGGDLALDLLPQMRAARRIFERHFTMPAREGAVEDTDFDLTGDDLPARLGEIGFPSADCDAAATILSHWAGNTRRALRSERAHALLRSLLPGLLTSFIAGREPLGCVRHFDTLLSRQRAGVQLLSLLERNPKLITRIVAIFDASPFLADHLADTPSALEGLLEPAESEDTALTVATGQIRLLAAEKPPLEILITRLRPVVRAEEFRLSVARLEGRLDEDSSAHARTAVADTVMAALLEAVFREHRDRHGRVEGGGITVVALGKAGSREMMTGSDLDLMLIFDHPDDVSHSSALKGATDRPLRALPVSQYYLRLANSFIAALTAPDAEGPLYAVDMRLRPSGAAGPVAVSRAAFRHYHAGSSWTWERMALTRARLVTIAGEPGAKLKLKAALQADLDRALTGIGQSRSPDEIRADAVAMRRRLARDLPPSGPWDVKRRAGGLMEVEFIAQTLQLVAGSAEARSPCTPRAFHLLARAGVLSRADARVLIGADETWRSLQSVLRLLWGPSPPADPMRDLPRATLDLLCGSMAVSGLPELTERVESLALTVREMFTRLIGAVSGGGEAPGKATGKAS